MTREEKLKLLQALEAKEARVKDQTIENLDLSLIQQAVLQCRAKVVMVIGSNRSGKSHIGGIFTVSRATGAIPSCMQGTFPMDKIRIGDYWISSLDFGGTRDITEPKIDLFLPQRFRDSFHKLDHIHRLKNNGQLGFKSGESGRKKYQGTSRLGVWLDEEHAEEVYDECYMRTIDCSGWLLLTFTPVEGLTWAYSKLYAKAGQIVFTKNKHGISEDVGVIHTPEQIALLKDRELVIKRNPEPDADDNVMVFQMSIYDNKFLPDQEIYNTEKKWANDPSSYNSRVLGRFTKLTGRNVFPAEELIKVQSTLQLRAPLRVGELTEKGVFHASLRGSWKIYKEKKPKEEGWYAIGADIAEGLNIGDYSVAQVIDMKTFEQVAVWRGKVSPEEFSHILYQLGTYYNNAYLAPERNFHGIAVVSKLRELRYPRLYYDRDRAEETVNASSVAGRKKFGWETNKKTKPIMIQELSSFIREKHIILNDVVTVDELITYNYQEDGSTAALGGCFDDCVIALSIALQVATTRPIPVSNQGIVEYDKENSITGY